MRRTFLVFLAALSFLIPNPPHAHGKAEEPAGGGDRRWAICIGVSKYRAPVLPVCSTAAHDAKGLALAMEEHGGFDQVFLFSDEAVERGPFFPSRHHIRKFLAQLPSRVRPGDTVLFSFSGNGWTDEAGRPFLLTADSRVDRLEETAVPLDEVFDSLRQAGVRRCVVLIDAARVYPDRYLGKGVTALFYAAARGYSSQSREGSLNSIFAENLIKGVRGEADRTYGGDRDGVVTLKELASYVNLAMAEWRAQAMARQIPSIEIKDNDHADMVVSSTQRVRTALERPPATPALASNVGRADTKTRSTRGQTRTRTEGPPEDSANPRGSAVSVGAPAPRIDDLLKDSKPQEEVKVVLKGRGPDRASSPASSQVAPGEENLSSGVGRVDKREEPLPALDQEPGERRSETRQAALSPDAKGRIVRLRAKPKEISAEEMKSILITRGFYSTCWSYNGDFCNPGGNFENHWQETGNGTVLDRATGLMWQKGGSAEPMKWSAARRYVEEANRNRLAEHSDWRIPTVEELASLVQGSWKNGDLFIDPVFDRAQRQCWSTDTRGPDAAWKVNFHQGYLMDFPVDSQSSVRLVRTAQ